MGGRGEVITLEAWVFLFHNTLWCYVWFAFLFFISFIFLCYHVYVVQLFENFLSNLQLDYIVEFSVKINLAIKLCVKGSKYCAKVFLAYFSIHSDQMLITIYYIHIFFMHNLIVHDDAENRQLVTQSSRDQDNTCTTQNKKTLGEYWCGTSQRTFEG